MRHDCVLLQGGQGEQVLATQRTPVYNVRGGAPDGRLPRPRDGGGVDRAVQQPAGLPAHHVRRSGRPDHGQLALAGGEVPVVAVVGVALVGLVGLEGLGGREPGLQLGAYGADVGVGEWSVLVRESIMLVGVGIVLVGEGCVLGGWGEVGGGVGGDVGGAGGGGGGAAPGGGAVLPLPGDQGDQVTLWQ